MRIASSQIYQQGINNMIDISRQLALTQQQVSSGKRFATPADDPVAASQVVQLNQELALREQYQKNIQQVSSQLSLEDSVLGQVTDVLQRIRELTVQAGDGALTAQDRASIATEITTRSEELMSLMNSRTASGEYMFAGSRGQTQPFQRNSAGDVEFKGDEKQRRVQVTASSSLPINDSGRGVFTEVPSVATTLSVSATRQQDVVGRGRVVDQAAVDALFPDGMVVQFNAVNAAGQPNFTVRRLSDNRVVGGLENVAYRPGDSVTAQGIELDLYGTAAPGDTLVLRTGKTQSVIGTVERLAGGLNDIGQSSEGLAQLTTLLDESLGNIDNAMDSILKVRAEVGARMNTADSAASLHQDVSVVSKDLLSKLQDVDYTKAISQLDMQTFVLQAAQQSYARISGLSLFDVL
jgi:flagellar hook-associated protein 3 FlgL